MNVPKSALIFTIDQLEIKHHKEMEKMKAMILEEQMKVKELEDKFGVTQRRRWGIRQRKWWLIWLANNDNDAYEYLMKTIHKTLLYGEGDSLRTGKKAEEEREKKAVELLSRSKRNLNHVHMSEKIYHDENINMYGMLLFSANNWWREGDPVICEVHRQTKDKLMECCKVNEINHKKSWGKKRFIRALLKHKTLEERNVPEFTLEELRELLKSKEEESN